jgi:hypothetical protein
MDAWFQARPVVILVEDWCGLVSWRARETVMQFHRLTTVGESQNLALRTAPNTQDQLDTS